MSDSQIFAKGPVGFGPVAAAWARRYSGRADVLIADGDGAGRALDEAVQRKRAGRRFFVVPIIEDMRAIIARRLAVQFFRDESEAGSDRRREFLSEVCAVSRSRDRVPDDDYDDYPNFLRSKGEQLALRDFMWMGDSLLVRSWAEYERITEALDETPLYATRALYMRPSARLPKRRPGPGRYVVVWAPETLASDLLLETFAVADRGKPVYVVCRNPAEGDSFRLEATFVGADSGRALLSEASAVVVAELSNPKPAMALARWAIPLLVPSTCGAEEYVSGATAYEPWNWESISAALSTALDSPVPRVREDVPTAVDYARELSATAPLFPPGIPLASVGIATKNRRELLPRALNSVSAQNYPNLEVVLINDGGVPVADIVARYPAVRLIERSTSSGVAAAVNEIVASTTGKYCVLLADDDYFFPDHVARCVYALERTGLSAARLMLIVTLLQPGKNERYEITGYVVHERYAYDPTELLWANNVGQLVYNKAAMTKIGLFDAGSGHAADWDYFMKYAVAGDLACVKSVTCNLDQRNDQTNSNDHGFEEWVRAVRRIYEKYPAPGRPYVEGQRNEVLARVLTRDPNRLSPMRAPKPLHPPRPGEYAVFRKQN